MSRISVSTIISFHREGLLARKSLLSLERCIEHAERHGTSVEVIATLDDADDLTYETVAKHIKKFRAGVLLEFNEKDLGEVRNRGIDAANGSRILICDGDDYLSEKMISKSQHAAESGPPDAIFHPQLVLYFGASVELAWQIPSTADEFNKDSMLMFNPWTSCCFASHSIFLQTRYQDTRPIGFGFEDWHWHCETIAKGLEHHIVPETVHYVRRKSAGSMSGAQASAGAVIRPTRLFRIAQ